MPPDNPNPTYAPNPQLVPYPAGTNPSTLDADYQAQQAQLAFEISQRYNDVLKQLGYTDPATGQFVQGRVETEADRQRFEFNRNYQIATEQATQARQQEGTLFSGRRGIEEARAQHPFVQGLADLDIQVPQQLGDLYESAGNLMTEYTNRQNLLLADAARRRAAGIINNPPAPTNPVNPNPQPQPNPHPQALPPINPAETGWSPNPNVDPRPYGHPIAV